MPNAGVATSYWKSGGPFLHMRESSERGTPHGRGVRGGEDTKLGGDLVGPGVLCGSGGIPPRTPEGRAGRLGGGQ